jgi:AraC-like DNA-binding protein
MNSFSTLRRAATRLAGERYVVDRPVDARGQYQLELAGEFPFAVKRLHFSADDPAPPLTWHTYLELFVLLSRECRLRIGGATVTLTAGDVLVMDHLKLHAVLDFPAAHAEAIVIRFLPEVVRGLGSAALDHLLLLPFYCQFEEQPHVLRGGSPAAGSVHATLAELFACYASSDSDGYWQTGSRAHFLVLLHHLAKHFHAAERLQDEFTRQQAKTNRLRKLFEHVEANYASRITLPDAAAIAGLSKPQFHAVFKKATGMTLVDYLTQVRLTHAVRLLRETDRSIAEIATQVGFADQSYFDRRFRRHFGRTPRQLRETAVRSARE